MSKFVFGAFVVLYLLVAIDWVFRPGDEPATWSLILEASDGQRYVMDHGLSLGDCYDAERAQRGTGWACEREDAL